jgi:phospholipid N-methyltransferase
MTLSADQAERNRAFARRDGGGHLWMFFRGFIKNPVMVGSVIPSSKMLIDKMLEPVDWASTKLFVEYGPGVGTFTQHILERLAPDATLITIDTNDDFTHYLSRKFTDSRLRAVTGSAAAVRTIIADCGFDKADYILSGLPFSTLPPGVGPAIAAQTAEALRPAARSWSTNSRPRSGSSLRPISSASTAASNGATSRPQPCSGPGRTKLRYCRSRSSGRARCGNRRRPPRNRTGPSAGA